MWQYEGIHTKKNLKNLKGDLWEVGWGAKLGNTFFFKLSVLYYYITFKTMYMYYKATVYVYIKYMY